MKLGPVWKMVTVVVLCGAAVWSIRYLDRIPAQRLAALLGISVSVSDPEATPKTTPTPSSKIFPTLGEQASVLGTVAVQTFSGPVLVRQGAGTAVSVDGLVLTTVVAAPYGSGSYVYQIATPRGQLLRARRVAGDAASGLVLLKADAGDLDAILFSAESLDAGAELEAVAGQIIASRFVMKRLPVWVVWSDGNRQAALSMDRAYAASLHGARLIDELGRSVGLVKNAAQPGIITTEVINVFLERYLAQEVRN